MKLEVELKSGTSITIDNVEPSAFMKLETLLMKQKRRWLKRLRPNLFEFYGKNTRCCVNLDEISAFTLVEKVD
jgi:hypothetical protein